MGYNNLSIKTLITVGRKLHSRWGFYLLYVYRYGFFAWNLESETDYHILSNFCKRFWKNQLWRYKLYNLKTFLHLGLWWYYDPANKMLNWLRYMIQHYWKLNLFGILKNRYRNLWIRIHHWAILHRYNYRKILLIIINSNL